MILLIRCLESELYVPIVALSTIFFERSSVALVRRLLSTYLPVHVECMRVLTTKPRRRPKGTLAIEDDARRALDGVSARSERRLRHAG